MKTNRRILASLVIVIVLLARPSMTSQATAYASAEAMVQAYYDSINLRDFQTAFTLWTRPTQTYNQFVTGFADTYLIDSYIGTFQAGSTNPVTGRIPVVLVAFRNDGTNASFYGCFRVRYTGSAGMNWMIDGADIRTIGNLYPSIATTQAYLSLNCFGNLANTGVTVTDRVFSTEQWMLLNYYQLVNQRQYAQAYANWLYPLPGPKPNGAPPEDYRTPYQQYVAGYAETRYVNLFMGDYVYMGPSAGHSYVLGVIPAVLVGQNTDGTFMAYYGCYAIGGQQGLPYSNIGILSGDFKLLSNGYPDGKLILQYLSFDCTGLNLRY